MQKIRIIANKHYVVGGIDRRIYGSLAEHMGRVVYSAIYEPEHPDSDDDGFRKDLIDAVVDAGITTVRYPGGNFVSTYEWENGVGERDKRPVSIDLGWKAIETNEFGTDEFMKWAKKTNVEPMLAVNLGTRGIMDAVHYLEYLNLPVGSKYSNMRAENGHADGYGVKLFCLGNEMDGEWQIGHKEADEYGRLAAETSKAMKTADPMVETILCGSSLNTMKTYPQWEASALEAAYPYVDYISLHQYFGGQEKGTESFLRQADEMDGYIRTVRAVCQYIKAKKRAKNDVMISFDEWGVWSNQATAEETDKLRWKTAPAISEMIYTFEDSLLFAGMLNSLLRNCDSVKIACQALVANISSMIMTEKGGDLWLQPNYYPFAAASHYALGTVLDIRKDEKEGILDAVLVYNEKNSEVVAFVINRSEKEDIELDIELQGFEAKTVLTHNIMHTDDIKATNQIKHNNVIPEDCNNTLLQNGRIVSSIPALSWNMIRIRV